MSIGVWTQGRARLSLWMFDIFFFLFLVVFSVLEVVMMIKVGIARMFVHLICNQLYFRCSFLFLIL